MMNDHRAATTALAIAALVSLAGCVSINSTKHEAPRERSAPAQTALVSAQHDDRAGRGSAADRALVALLDEDLEALKKANPVEASQRGDARFDRLLPDASEAAAEAFVRNAQDRLLRLERIDRDALSQEHRVNYDMLARALRERVRAGEFRSWQMAVSQISGPQQALLFLPDQLNIQTPEQRRAYIERLRAVPRHLEQTAQTLRAGLARGFTPPRVTLLGVAEQTFAAGGARFEASPEEHPMYRPFLGLDQNDPLAVEAREAIATRVAPAFEEFGEFLRSKYVPRARESLGASELPGGRDFYQAQLEYFTTTRMTAEEIHETGLAEVARIRADMLDTIRRSDFMRLHEDAASLSGDDLFRAFTQYLREDARFYPQSESALLAAYRDVAKRIDAELPKLFGTLPRLSYGVRKMPDFMSATAPTAYYMPGSYETGVPGFFVANTYDLRSRPLYETVSLTLHEAAPGHHHQIALAQEVAEKGQHPWRAWQGFTAYVEGWGLYSEYLGYEMERSPETPLGMYTDPYMEFGRQTYEMWRAMRLVVDTGVHAMGWTREQAIEYMLGNSGLSRQNVTAEVDRYIAWPGQATAYKIGELKIRELRKRAEEALGERFDIRAFHDAVLLEGAIPLDALEAKIDAWIQAQR